MSEKADKILTHEIVKLDNGEYEVIQYKKSGVRVENYHFFKPKDNIYPKVENEEELDTKLRTIEAQVDKYRLKDDVPILHSRFQYNTTRKLFMMNMMIGGIAMFAGVGKMYSNHWRGILLNF